MSRLYRTSRRFAAGLPVLLLGTSVALVTLLTWQAYQASTSHRALAERVLHDYADLAATELGRRVTSFIGTYGFGAAIRGLSAATAHGPEIPPSPEQVAAALPPQSRRAAELVGLRFLFDPSQGSFVVAGGVVPGDAQAAIIDAVRQPDGRPGDYRVLSHAADETLRLFVFTVSRPPGARLHAGFEADLAAMGRWFDEFIVAEPLLPGSLAARDAAQSSVRVLVRAPDASVLFASPERPWPAVAGTVRRALDDAADNSLRGFVAEVAIDPAAASRLIIGGLPSSRVGLLLALLLLTLGLTAAAIVQVGRGQALVRLREEFVTRASHDLRTPVAQIRMFADTLRLGRVRTEEEQQRSLAAIDRGARRLSHLVDNVMQFALRESGSGGRHRELSDVAELARQAIDDFDAMTGTGRVTLDSQAYLAVPVDAEAFRQILLNLLDNALKYGRCSDAPITVRLSAGERQVHISVEDAGPGIPASERERVWQPYVRLDRDRRSAVGGTGIGLAIVRDLVSQHRGTVRIDEAPAGGTRVVITLPDGRAGATAAVAASGLVP